MDTATRSRVSIQEWTCAKTTERSDLLNSILTSKWTKVVVFLACLAPVGMLVWRGLHNDLTANAVEFVEHQTGDLTIRFLILTLAITPLRKILKLPQLIRF